MTDQPEPTNWNATKTPDGWYIHGRKAADFVVRTEGSRLTVAVVPEGETPPATPLNVALAKE